MSARNRELVNLVAVGILTALGFASVYIARQDVISAGSISYALIFLGLYVCASFAARLAVPWADPYLLPLAGLLTAVGLTEIYRLGPSEAFRQGFWIVIGVAAFSVTLLALRRDFRVLESYKYLFGLSAIGLLILPALPHFGTTINGARLWVRLGPLQFQPGELAKIALIVFLAGYLREKREVLAQGRLKDFGPLLLIWGAAMLVLVETNDLGSALLYFGIFLAMLYVATGRALFVAIGLVLWSAFTTGCGLAGTFTQLLILRMGVGVGEAALSPAAYSLITDCFPRERLATGDEARAYGHAAQPIRRDVGSHLPQLGLHLRKRRAGRSPLQGRRGRLCL